MITHVFLENWRSHQSTSLSFRKGTNLLVGIMGSGKSSVLDGISFALFGNFPALEHKKITLEEMVMHEKENARVKLGFNWNGEEYEIIRVLRKDKKLVSEAEIRKAGKLIEKGQKAVTEYVEQLLQVDYDLFSRAIYSEQNGIDRFLSLDPGKRKQEMDQLLGLDKFESARASVVKILNVKKNLAKELGSKFSKSRLEEIKIKEKEAENKLVLLEQKKKDVRQVYMKWSKECEHANSVFSLLKEKKEKSDELKQIILTSKGAIANLSEELLGKEIDEKLLKEAEAKKFAAESELEQVKKALINTQIRQNELFKEAGSLKEKIEAAKQANVDLEKVKAELEKLLMGKTIDELENEKKLLEKESLELNAKLQAVILEITKLEEGKKRLSKEKDISKCPVCRSTLTKDGIAHVLKEYEHDIATRKEEARKLEQEAQEKSARLRMIRLESDNIKKLTERSRILAKNATGLNELEEKYIKIQTQSSELEIHIKEMREKAEELQKCYHKAFDDYKLMSDMVMKKKRMEQKKELLKKSEHELESLKFSEKEFEQTREALERARLEFEKAALLLKSLEKEIKSESDLLVFLSDERKSLEKMEKRIVKLEKLCEELLIYKNALVETQALLRAEVVDAINTAMNEIWGIVYPYGDYKGVRMLASEKGYEFEVYNGEWRTAGLVSGGERASIAIALRIALATVLTPNMSMLILDEPTHNLDKEGVGFLAHALQYNLPELVEQSFVITHEEGLMGSEFASTYRLTRNKEANTPTSVEEM